jgi:hypothetical protein
MDDEEYYGIDDDGWTVIGAHYVNPDATGTLSRLVNKERSK